MNRQNIFIASGGVLAVFLAIVIIATMSMGRVARQEDTNLNTDIRDKVSDPEAKLALVNPKRTARDNSSSLTFEEALLKFEGRRIQIDNCVPSPTRVTYKNGTKIMLDSRSPEGQEIKIGDKVYRLNDYDFSIITIQSAKVPVTLQMDCQSGDQIGKNIAQILVQK